MKKKNHLVNSLIFNDKYPKARDLNRQNLIDYGLSVFRLAQFLVQCLSFDKFVSLPYCAHQSGERKEKKRKE